MSTVSVSTPFPIFTDIDGQPLENGYIFIGIANLGPIGNPINVYWDAALTIPAAQPIRTLGGYPINNGTPARLYVNSQYSIQVQNRNGSVVYSAPFDTEFMSSANVSYTPAGTGAVATTVQAKLRESVSVLDFGGAAGAGDNTAAMNAAAAYLNTTFSGGVILIPYVGEWRMNWVCLFDNITVQGVGGGGEYNLNCIRPYSISSPAITFGNGTVVVRYCGLDNVHISGIPVAGAGAGGITQAALNASHALLLKGGTVNFTVNRVVLYNGVRSFGLEPSVTQPVTGVRFNDGTIRNDLTDSANARCIRVQYVNSSGYATDNKFQSLKLNGPTLGYAAEVIDCLFEVNDSYWDIKPEKGILLDGAAGLVCYNLQLDPGTSDVVVIGWTDTTADPARYIRGILRHGGQRYRNISGTLPLPNEADSFSYKHRLLTPYLSSTVYLSQITDPYNETAFFDRAGTVAGSPVRLGGVDFAVAKNLQIYGGNAVSAGYITANSGGGGLYFEATGTNQNVRLVPSGTGSNILAGAGTYPSGDNTQPIGLAGQRWSVVYAGTGAINTSDAREKQDIADLDAVEKRVAVALKGLVRKFRFNDAVQAKGDAARIHVGVVAQEVIAAFEAQGLDANRYAIVCYDEWEARAEEFIPEVVDENGLVISPGRYSPAIPAGNRYGVRYEELLAFIISAL